jgi:hypothetical protein
MNHACRVPLCGAATSSRYSPYCRRHKSTLRRHGGTGQTAVSKAELAPYLASVRRRISRNSNSPLWDLLDGAWSATVAAAHSDAHSGNRYQRLAAHEVLNLDADASPREIGTTALAMFMLWHDRPSRFETDRAFRHQLVRRVRALSQRHVGVIYDHRSGRSRRTYREITPKAAAILGQTLARCFGAAGLQLAELDRRDREAASQTVQSISNAIKELK